MDRLYFILTFITLFIIIIISSYLGINRFNLVDALAYKIKYSIYYWSYFAYFTGYILDHKFGFIKHCMAFVNEGFELIMRYEMQEARNSANCDG
jgi:hypothetical protein